MPKLVSTFQQWNGPGEKSSASQRARQIGRGIDLRWPRQTASWFAIDRTDKVVAMLEVVSAGNKATEPELDNFVKKAVDAAMGRNPLSIIDLHAPTPAIR